jgi:hypothetical protein
MRNRNRYYVLKYVGGGCLGTGLAMLGIALFDDPDPARPGYWTWGPWVGGLLTLVGALISWRLWDSTDSD